MNDVPALRIQQCNDAPIAAGGDYVVYWMIAFRRLTWNFSLQGAVEWARQLKKPLVILEPLRVNYPWASDRLHRFVLDGMSDTCRQAKNRPVLYYPYVEPARCRQRLAGHVGRPSVRDRNRRLSLLFPAAWCTPPRQGLLSDWKRSIRTASCRLALPTRFSQCCFVPQIPAEKPPPAFGTHALTGSAGRREVAQAQRRCRRRFAVRWPEASVAFLNV